MSAMVKKEIYLDTTCAQWVCAVCRPLFLILFMIHLSSINIIELFLCYALLSHLYFLVETNTFKKKYIFLGQAQNKMDGKRTGVLHIWQV